MIKYDFDAQLIGEEGGKVPVFCEVQPPHVAGQKAQIRMSVPVQHLPQTPPRSPCKLVGTCGALAIKLEGVHWRTFPTSSPFTLGLEEVELLHVDRLIVKFPTSGTKREIRFHLAPISFLRSASSLTRLGSASHSEELFVLDLPGIGVTSFVMEWVTRYQRDAEIPGASISIGFSAVVCLSEHGKQDVDELVTQFKKALDVLSVLFRQAVSLHGWTYRDNEIISTWISPLDPNVTCSAHEDRGEYVARPQGFAECATGLAQAFGKADKAVQSLTRHLSLALNPHQNLRGSDHFMFMFAAFERVIEYAWMREKASFGQTSTTGTLVKHLEELNKAILAEGGEDAPTISARIKGLIGIVGGPSYRDKLQAFLRVYPTMGIYSRDLWPIVGTEKERGLRELRNAIAHGSSSFVSVNVVAVAEWHLAILIERVIFVLLNLAVPEGITPDSYLLKAGARGWYEREWWEPLRIEVDQPI
jgi:hypothetical protein